ncbi:MAG: hypothetical protein WDN00_09755 [Limisphaerales bacterium]
MFVRLGQVLMIVALLAATESALGAHFNPSRGRRCSHKISQSTSLSQALTKTFDGKHPCPLCKVVATGKSAEKKSAFTLEQKKLEFPPASERLVMVAPTQFELLPQTNFSAEVLIQQPPPPPPRSLFV